MRWMPEPSKDRARKYKLTQRERGLTRLQLWVPLRFVEQIRRMVVEFLRGEGL